MVENARIAVLNNQPSYLVDKPRIYQAIAIAADSDIDRCIIIPNGKGAPIAAANGLAGSIDRQRALDPAAIHVSVEAPWFGEVQGPFTVLMPYGRATRNSKRMRPPDDGFWHPFLASAQLPHAELSLNFHGCAPPMLPVKRAPLEAPFNYPEFGTTGAASPLNLIIPAYGRRQVALSIGFELNGLAGEASWTFLGKNTIDTEDNSLIVNSSEVLQALTAVSGVDQDATYFFNGEFDYYQLQITETSPLDAGARIWGVFKAWD